MHTDSTPPAEHATAGRAPRDVEPVRPMKGHKGRAVVHPGGMISTDTITDSARGAFYKAGLLGLRALDQQERSARRLGPDADHHWAEFAGSLDAADRVDLLFRDAAVTWRAAFSPAVAFALPGLAPDEPFGPDWKSLTSGEARRALAEVPTDADLKAAASVLEMGNEHVAIPALSPRDRVVVVGAPAVVSLAAHFLATPSLSWADQVVVVASSSSGRQLAGLAAVFLRAGSATRLTEPMDKVSVLAFAKWQRADHVVHGTRLTDAERSIVRALAEG